MQKTTYELRKNAIDEEDKLMIKTWFQKDSKVHDHDCFELSYVLEGEAVQNINGIDKNVKKGDYFIIDYGSFHSYHHTKEFKLMNCQFFPEIIDDTMAGYYSFDKLLNVCLIRYHKKYLGETPVNRVFRDDDGRVLELLEGILEEYATKEIGYQDIFSGRLLEILLLTMRKVVKEQVGKGKEYSGECRVVLEAMDYLKKNYAKKAVLTKFCENKHYSQQYLSRKFKQETGMTALEYLQKLRIEKSCQLLLRGNMPVEEIAYHVGYDSLKFYRRIFERMVGMSPSKYRNLALSK